MNRYFNLLLCTVFLLLSSLVSNAQTVQNKKLAESDLKSAQAEIRKAGGAEAQLVYATRLDAATKGVFDCLVVVYAKGNDYFATILREGKRHALKAEQGGQAIKTGDRFQRLGIRYETGKAPLLRFFSLGGGDALRMVDYRFNGVEFVVEGG